MTRPYVQGPRGGLVPDMQARLYVQSWETVARPVWRLVWARPGQCLYSGAEGECSAQRYKTRRAAVAAGVKLYGETAVHWRDGAAPAAV